jgi:hypothetical protein
MNTLKNKLKKRRKILFAVLCIVFGAAIWYLYLYIKNEMSIEQFVEEFVAIALSALVSTFLAIWITKNDIIEDDFSMKKDKAGIITIETGYKKFFQTGDSKSYLNVSDFKEFFTKNNRDKSITIVGIALSGFFSDENEPLVEMLLNLCINKSYNVKIILANPFSDEVRLQAMAQNKTSVDHIANSIKNTHMKFLKAIEKMDRMYDSGSINCSKRPSHFLNSQFSLTFSSTLPKALIIRSGEYMIITPYQMQPEGPSYAPTMVVKDADADGYYEQYKKYIERIFELSVSWEGLCKNKMVKEVFTQPYGNDLSEQFYEDLHSCNSLSILGLGQNKMFTNLEIELRRIVKQGGSICAVMAKPDGASTEMCVARSLIHSKLKEAISEHKRAINILISIRDSFNAGDRVKVYTWDCFFPYTMYAFNMNDPKQAKMYIWITNMFAYSNERDGFVIDGKFEYDMILKYAKQYEKIINAAIHDGGEINAALVVEE